MNLKLGNLHNLDAPLQRFVRPAGRIAICTNNCWGVFPTADLDNPKPSHAIFVDRKDHRRPADRAGLIVRDTGDGIGNTMFSGPKQASAASDARSTASPPFLPTTSEDYNLVRSYHLVSYRSHHIYEACPTPHDPS